MAKDIATRRLLSSGFCATKSGLAQAGPAVASNYFFGTPLVAVDSLVLSAQSECASTGGLLRGMPSALVGESAFAGTGTTTYGPSAALTAESGFAAAGTVFFRTTDVSATAESGFEGAGGFTVTISDFVLTSASSWLGQGTTISDSGPLTLTAGSLVRQRYPIVFGPITTRVRNGLRITISQRGD